MLEHVKDKLDTAHKELVKDRSILPYAFWLCWSFVDIVHRIRELTKAAPSLSKKSPAVRLFLDTTSVAEEFRHYIQHLGDELSKKPGNTFPVWGSLAWLDPQDPLRCYCVIAGAVIGEMNYAWPVYDTVEQKWVSKITLSVRDLSFNFDPIFESCMQFKNFVLPSLHSNYAPGIKVQELEILSMQLEHSPAEIPSSPSSQ